MAIKEYKNKTTYKLSKNAYNKTAECLAAYYEQHITSNIERL